MVNLWSKSKLVAASLLPTKSLQVIRNNVSAKNGIGKSLPRKQELNV